MFTDAQYADEFSYLADYVREDWLGLSVITGTAAKLLGEQYSLQAERELSLRVIADLMDIGARAGDLSEDSRNPFQPWPLAKEAALIRIDREWRELGRSPESGDICWLTAD